MTLCAKMSAILILCLSLFAACSAVRQPNTTVTAPTYVVNLDLAPADRWTDIVTIYKSSAPLIIDYFTKQVGLWGRLP